MNIMENLDRVKERIQRTAAKSGRKPEDIRLIAVTKTIEPERITKAVELGIRDLGENRVQELSEKYDKINMDCHWHIIGHLQTNKVKYIMDKVSMIHSLDSMGLAMEIEKRARQFGRVADVLVQVNIAKEESKFGLYEDQVLDFVKAMSPLECVKVRGLMTIAPYVEDPEDARWVFRSLRKLLIDIRAENIDNISMDYLSMGMSNDFEVAIEEGADMVRIGTALFGQRQYSG